MSHFQLERQGAKPVLSVKNDVVWEREGVLNPGIFFLNGEVIMLYRAVGERVTYTSHIGYAKSRDGIHFERVTDQPVFGPGKPYDAWATEDPRITVIEGAIYVTYVAVPERIMDNGREIFRTIPLETSGALLRTKDFMSYERLGIISPPKSDNKDVVLFSEKINGRYRMLHRPNRWSKEWLASPYASKVNAQAPCPIDQLPDHPGIWSAESDDLVTWENHRLLLWPSHHEDAKIGPGLPPLKTDLGWLLIYHHVEYQAERLVYSVRAALLDLVDPSKILAKLPYDILSPETDYETAGGTRIVFPTGGFIKDSRVWVYYGASDRSVGLATGSLSELLAALTHSDE